MLEIYLSCLITICISQMHATSYLIYEDELSGRFWMQLIFLEDVGRWTSIHTTKIEIWRSDTYWEINHKYREV